jgi:hypothetical protein
MRIQRKVHWQLARWFFFYKKTWSSTISTHFIPPCQHDWIIRLRLYRLSRAAGLAKSLLICFPSFVFWTLLAPRKKMMWICAHADETNCDLVGPNCCDCYSWHCFTGHIVSQNSSTESEKQTKARELHIKSAKWNVGEKRVQINFISEHKQTYQIL